MAYYGYDDRKFQLNSSSCLGGVVVTRFCDYMTITYLVSHGHQKCLSDAQLDTQRNIP